MLLWLEAFPFFQILRQEASACEMKTVSWFVKLTVIALFRVYSTSAQKVKKKKKLFSQAWIWRFIFWKSNIQGSAHGPGPLSTSSWPQGRVSSWLTTSEAVHWTLLLTNSCWREASWWKRGCVWRAAFSPQACCPHLPPSTRPVTGLPQFPAWLGSTALSTSLQEVSLPPRLLGHPQG